MLLTVCSRAAPKGLSILARKWLIWVSTTEVLGSNWKSHTRSSSIVRVTTRPSCRTRTSSRVNSLGNITKDRPALCLTAQKVQFQIGHTLHGLHLLYRRPPSQRIHPGKQFGKGERLGQIVAAARLQPLDPVVNAAKGGQEQDRRRAPCRPQRPYQRQPVQSRDHAIDHQHIIGRSRGLKQPGGAIGQHIADMAMLGQAARDVLGGRGIVLDQQDAHGDLATAKAGIKDFEITWDDNETGLRPIDPARWGLIDDAADPSLSALRARKPDPVTVNESLTALQATLAPVGPVAPVTK